MIMASVSIILEGIVTAVKSTRNLANDIQSQHGKLLFHRNLGLAISKRCEPLQKLVHAFIEGWKECLQVATGQGAQESYTFVLQHWLWYWHFSGKSWLRINE